MNIGSECTISCDNLTLFINEIYLKFDQNIHKNVFKLKNQSNFRFYVNYKVYLEFFNIFLECFNSKFKQ